MSNQQIRNIAIIAHVDHGKTTMVDQLLRQSGTFAEHEKVVDTVMDNNAIEKERGITILAKNCAVTWKGMHINIVDTPGHADFGGEVERALSMVDGVVLLIDAQEGPMPQTRFVTKKALALGLKPDPGGQQGGQAGCASRPRGQRRLRPVRQAGRHRRAARLPGGLCLRHQRLDVDDRRRAPGEQWGPDMSALFDTVLKHVPAHAGDPAAPLQLQISALDFSTFVGRIGVGRVNAGTIKSRHGRGMVMEGPDGKSYKGRSTRC
jgi:GTP-binding protein